MRIPQRLTTFLSSREEEMVDFLQQLVELETPSTEPETQAAAFELLSLALTRIGYRVKVSPGKKTGGFLLARPQARHRPAPFQLLLGHTDTVWPSGTLRQMPFRREKDQLHGPGIFDMKGGLTLLIFALEALARLDLEPTVTPLLLINSDEEIGSIESETIIRRMARRANRVFVLEPPFGDDGKLKTARKGVGQFRIDITGRASHAGLEPEMGASAILELSYLIQTLTALNSSERGITVNVGLVEGGLRPNVVPPSSQAVVDVRVRHRRDIEPLEKTFYSLRPRVPGVSLRVEGSIDRPPLERTGRNIFLWERAREAAGNLGFELRETVAGGASDGNTTSLYTATLDGLGAVGGGAHAQHEFVLASQLGIRAALLALLLLEPALPATLLADSQSSERADR